MTRICSALTLVLVGLSGAACGGGGPAVSETRLGFLSGFDLDVGDALQWHLPNRLREISGLAVATDGRLFGHDDERAIIYEIDPHDGALVKAFAFGEKGLRGDFEGIAWVDGHVFLVDSSGRLLRGREGADGETIEPETWSTGLDVRCEVEGLAHDVRRGLLLIACKKARTADLEGRVAIFAWDLARQQMDAVRSFSADEAAIAARLGTRHFNPSAIDLTPDGTHVLLLAGRQHALAELDLAGNFVSGLRLSKKRHPQPEGLAVDTTRALLIADEGTKGRGRLAVYQHRG